MAGFGIKKRGEMLLAKLKQLLDGQLGAKGQQIDKLLTGEAKEKKKSGWAQLKDDLRAYFREKLGLGKQDATQTGLSRHVAGGASKKDGAMAMTAAALKSTAAATAGAPAGVSNVEAGNKLAARPVAQSAAAQKAAMSSAEGVDRSAATPQGTDNELKKIDRAMAGTAVISGGAIALGAAGILPLGVAVSVGCLLFPACSWLLGRLGFELRLKAKNKRARNVQRKAPRE
jgi:hypothetical protein